MWYNKLSDKVSHETKGSENMAKFSKQMMIDRLTKEGLADKIDEGILAIMDNLDGQEATTACWNRQVYGEPVLWCIGKDGEGHLVNENDCR